MAKKRMRKNDIKIIGLPDTRSGVACEKLRRFAEMCEPVIIRGFSAGECPDFFSGEITYLLLAR